MKYLSALIILCVVKLSATDVSCEKIDKFLRWIIVGELRACHMQEATKIDTSDVEISTALDSSIEGLTLQGNKKVSYLPQRASKAFPNLLVYDAGDCSINSVSNENFKGLEKLQQLFLCCNLIENINSDTFVDLVSLSLLGLDKNKLKSIDGGTFKYFNKLKGLWLNGNDCIDEDFFDKSGQDLEQQVNKKCQRALKVDMNCGRVLFGKGNVVGGNKTSRGQWPFMASLYYVEQGSHICGGNVISSRHVVTAAHCVKNKQESIPLAIDALAVLLGRHNLARIELNSLQIAVKDIKIHPNWKSFTDNFDSDIAILVLRAEIEFSMFIQPICLPLNENIEKSQNGFVVGWGRSEFTIGDNPEQTPRQAAIQSVNDSVCFTTNPKIAFISSLTTFCGGGNNIGPCNGDSGGGFYVRTGDAWTLKGIVSSALATGSHDCGTDSFSVYTNVIKFVSWIQDIVKST